MRINLSISHSYLPALKIPFNQCFGSVFRTHTNPTLFAYLLQRYADIYTSSIENFSLYPHNFTFSARRVFLPHEIDITKKDAFKVCQFSSFPNWRIQGLRETLQQFRRRGAAYYKPVLDAQAETLKREAAADAAALETMFQSKYESPPHEKTRKE